MAIICARFIFCIRYFVSYFFCFGGACYKGYSQLLGYYFCFYVCVSPLSALISDEYHFKDESKKDSYSLDTNFRLLMDCKKIWKSADLSADDVVRLLGTNRTYFSRFLQETYHANFRTLINERRIIEAQDLLRSCKTLSISEVALDMGFSSISSFNLWFKKITGISPTVYRNTSD